MLVAKAKKINAVSNFQLIWSQGSNEEGSDSLCNSSKPKWWLLKENLAG